VAGAGFAGDGGKGAGFDHPDKGRQSAEQIHDFPGLRTDAGYDRRIFATVWQAWVPFRRRAEANQAEANQADAEEIESHRPHMAWRYDWR
jgi:hypothetical protein